MKDNCEKLKIAIKNANKICVFTGAGISCPSGIPDFRSADGLYAQDGVKSYSPEEVLSHLFFYSHPDLFYEFYKNKMVYKDAKPNLAHEYFANLEKQGKDITIITQNIDGLHQMAGSSNVFELHGSIYRNHCTYCGESYGLNYILQSNLPRCKKCNSVIKPDVVLYGEMLPFSVTENAIKAISECDLLIVVGTSLTVQPAASFLEKFKGETLALINKSKTDMDNKADIVINDNIVEVVRKLI